jgi:hypothetical protein
MGVVTPMARRSWREQQHTRVYFSPVGESVWENLILRHDRPYQLYRDLMPEVLAKLGMPDEQRQNVKFRWSTKAGCSCGCSPGIVLDRALYGEDGKVFDVDVEVFGEHHDPPVNVEYVASTVMGLGVVDLVEARA